jgi:hypothetical protein
MTALTVAAQLDEDASLRPVPWRRMAWVTWRQHRLALGGVAAVLSGLAVYLWVVGRQLHNAYAAATACHPASSIACSVLVGRFNGVDGFLANGYVLQAVPGLIGAFIGAPVLAHELETCTFRYAWTQGFGRWRWALAKLVALAALVAAAATVLGVLFSWYYQVYFTPGNQALSLLERSPLAPGLFDLRGVGFGAWTLAAFAIGALAGVIVRRVVPAIVATLVAYTGLASAAGLYLRQHYLTALVTTNPSMWVSPGAAWVISQQWTAKGGQPVSQSVVGRVLQGAPPELTGKGIGVPKALGSVHYLVLHGYTLRTSYQPASRFWPFQWIESGWLLALSLLLIAATVWLVRRRST